ncbi:AMIN domain-containing protein [Roseofilum capinflatum]|uniref:AMIN domain-containing protein n=1 Tax=Roseofilum capinflatum BLCC-M114 TaxID=3022440 RepID=A0ABT7BC59_9CYAN|nr:AMIN domain-containing protein [Roseofilum capinflatum]MDJ1176747.1 AMIN domain-containing protein [Roseofilum capinflatum BLCC-M114]
MKMTVNGLGWLGAIALSFLACPSLAGELRQWQYDPLKTELELTLAGEISPRYFVFENPLRVIIELPNTEIQVPIEKNSYSGAVQQISLERSNANQTQLILYLSPGVRLAPESVAIESYPTSAGLYKMAIRPLMTQDPSTSVLNLPPGRFEPPANQPLVSVPDLFPRSQPPATQTEEPTPGASAASLVTQPASVETTPDLVGMRRRSPSPTPAPTSDLPPIGSTVIPVIEFGQDFPSSNSRRRIAENTNSVLPGGIRLKLRYPGQESLYLSSSMPLQEVLIVHEAITDRQGSLLIPVGTPVIGQFQTQGQQSRFQATALVLGSEGAFPIQGQSDRLTSPIVEPGQVIEVRLGR